MENDFVQTDLSKGFKVSDGRVLSRKIALPAHQVLENRRSEAYTTIALRPPTNLFTNGATVYSFTLNKANSVKRIRQIWIKVDVKCVNANVQLVPVTHFFQQIKVKHTTDNSEIRTYFDDSLAFSLYSFMDDSKLRSSAKLFNIDPRFTSIFGLGPVITPNQTRSFYLPLVGNVFETLKADWSSANLDLEFEFTPANEGIVAVGNSSNVQCVGMSFIIDQPISDESDHLVHNVIESNYWKTVNYLDPIRLRFQSTLLTSGQAAKIDLSNLTGRVSHLLILVRNPGASNIGWTKGQYLNLGDEQGALIDIKTDSNQSIFGNGGAIPTKFLRDSIISSQLASELPARDPIYAIPFCKNMAASLSGQFHGSFLFSGLKYSLEITPQAGVDEVQTFACSAAPGDGQYRFFLDGEFSASLAYNATAAQMKAAFEALTFCKRRGITVAFSGALADNVTATIRNPTGNGLEQRLIQVIANNLNNAGTEVSVETSLTTAGVSGLATGSYDVDIICFYQKRGYWVRQVISEKITV